MAQYIDKDALVAEIKDMKGCKKSDWHFDEFDEGYKSALEDILSFLDTPEVKEVDLDAEIMKYQREIYDRDTTVRDIAKHFFELGLKSQHSSINIPNIDDLFEEDDIDPYSKKAKIFKESYYMALERLKEEKGEEV